MSMKQDIESKTAWLYRRDCDRTLVTGEHHAECTWRDIRRSVIGTAVELDGDAATNKATLMAHSKMKGK